MGIKLTKETYDEFAIKNDIKHFKYEEFVKEKDGYIDSDLVLFLEKVRRIIKSPIIIASGYRSVKKNIDVGGAKKSYHLKGEAVDVLTLNLRPDQIYIMIKEAMLSGIKGIIVYPRHIHFDLRTFDFFALGSYNKK